MRIVGVLLLLLAAGALVARYVPATNRALLAVAALSPYLMFGAPLAVLVFALSRHWTLVSVAAVLTVAVLAVQMPWYIGSPDPGTGTTLRFVSANLLLGEAEPAAVASLAAEQADILAVQELTPELAAALSSALARDFPYSALRPRERAAGVGLWSRYPIVTSGSDESFGRGLIYAAVQVPDTDAATTVVSTHMPPPRSAFDSWRSDIARLGSVLRELPPGGPVVVGGDLNATPDVREFRQLLRDGYRDGAKQVGAGLTRTYPSDTVFPPALAVDHIMTRDASVTSLRTVQVSGSDHLALAATVVLH
ncbi:MAG: endonuclease/exonuclease/phosphatase family protein [Mycobacterium sp.]|nr:endonuclease/exonuclease/phosphatase family protein [Mycobacterium sp.]